MVMAVNLFKLDSPESDIDMTTTKVAVQPQGPLADRKFIKKKKKKKHKHNRVAGGNEIVDVETSKHNEESQIHEKSLLNSDVDVFERQEEELEISIVVKRLEQQKTSKTEANLKKQTEESLMAQDEANKLQEEAMKHLGEANETMGNFRRVKKPLTDVRFKPETLLSSREQKKRKGTTIRKTIRGTRGTEGKCVVVVYANLERCSH
ncbi:hypothetical protein F2Q69_00028206 [Brassica cretica]|uniref:Uncharacterized protein n=1 Tax=Brassica cretica TaxID=69181 RepID=A0A8S9SAD7_BRACR|nr:hypothetical protein F2Q69_00028206 [Brassica cretica]